jgi:hypothetical protein
MTFLQVIAIVSVGYWNENCDKSYAGGYLIITPERVKAIKELLRFRAEFLQRL